MYHVRRRTAHAHYTELTKLHIIMNDQVGQFDLEIVWNITTHNNTAQ